MVLAMPILAKMGRVMVFCAAILSGFGGDLLVKRRTSLVHRRRAGSRP